MRFVLIAEQEVHGYNHFLECVPPLRSEGMSISQRSEGFSILKVDRYLVAQQNCDPFLRFL